MLVVSGFFRVVFVVVVAAWLVAPVDLELLQGLVGHGCGRRRGGWRGGLDGRRGVFGESLANFGVAQFPWLLRFRVGRRSGWRRRSGFGLAVCCDGRLL